MKKVVITAVAVLSFVASNAQELKYGVKLGFNMSNYSGDVQSANPKLGSLIGGFVEIKISDKFAVQPEVIFSEQGSKIKESVSGPGYSYAYKITQKLNYINVPVMAKFYPVEKLFIEAGPQIGFLLSAKSVYTETITSGIQSDVKAGKTDDIKKFINSTDFGLGFGLGFNFSQNISAGVRYTTGLSNIDKDPTPGYKITNTNIALTASYRF